MKNWDWSATPFATPIIWNAKTIAKILDANALAWPNTRVDF